MSEFLGIPLVQFFDNSGDPLSGGKLFVYEVGTTTAKDSYPTLADATASSNANTNPVILDSRGEAPVVLVGQNKLVLKDSDDVVLWTVDNFNIPESIFVVDLVDSSGNEYIRFSETASAVNEFTISNAATGTSPIMKSSGDNTDIDFTIRSKGSGTIVIEDGNSNEVLVFAAGIASAVNYIQVTNAATGNAPIIAAAGDDTNIDIELQLKGTGALAIKGTADSAGGIRLYEDTDNGTNYMGIKAPDTITTSVDLVLPDGDGTNGQVLQTNGSGTLTWSAAGASAASQAEQEAATSTTVYVSPGRQQYHPSACKCWVKTDAAGTNQASYNVSSIADTGTGQMTITIDTNFSSVNYAVTLALFSSGKNIGTVDTASQVSGSVRVESYHEDTGILTDPFNYYVTMFGDQ